MPNTPDDLQRKMAELEAQRALIGDAAVDAALAALLHDANCDLATRIVTAACQRGGALLFFDGLDEVPLDGSVAYVIAMRFGTLGGREEILEWTAQRQVRMVVDWHVVAGEGNSVII